MSRPGPRMILLGVKEDPEVIAELDRIAAEESAATGVEVNRSEIVRRGNRAEIRKAERRRAKR